MNEILLLALILLLGIGWAVAMWRTVTTGGSYPARTSRSARHWSTDLPDEPYRDRIRIS